MTAHVDKGNINERTHKETQQRFNEAASVNV